MKQVFLVLIIFALGALGGISATMLTLRRVLAPEIDHQPTSDAIVVLAGSPADRVAEGLRLVEQEVAEALVLSVGVDAPRGWAQVGDLCETEQAVDIYCVVPQSNSTIGEAATISRLAEEQGWSSLTLVTSRYHLDRATVYFDTCFDGEIFPVASEPARITWPLVRHEMLGAVHARTIGRFCPAAPPDGSPPPIVVAAAGAAQP